MTTTFALSVKNTDPVGYPPLWNKVLTARRECNFLLCTAFLYFFALHTLAADAIYIDKAVEAPRSILNAFQNEQDACGGFHLFTHGRPGELLLASQWMDATEVADFLRPRLGNGISYLYVYGCEFAKGEKGHAAVKQLEQLLGMPIAASDDITGVNGDWDLEIGAPCQSMQNIHYPYSLQVITYMDENFSSASGTTPPPGWSQTTAVGNASDVWHFDNPGNRTFNSPITSPAAIFDSDNYSCCTGDPEEVILYSSVFDFSTTTFIDLTLSWDQYFRSIGSNEIKVEVFDGTKWWTLYSSTSSTPDPESRSINVVQYFSGVSNAQVRFRYFGDYSWYWMVDNVNLSGETTQFLEITPDMFGLSTEIDGYSNGSFEDISPFLGLPAGAVEVELVGVDTRFVNGFGPLKWSLTNTGDRSSYFRVRSNGTLKAKAFQGRKLNPLSQDNFESVNGRPFSFVGSLDAGLAHSRSGNLYAVDNATAGVILNTENFIWDSDNYAPDFNMRFGSTATNTNSGIRLYVLYKNAGGGICPSSQILAKWDLESCDGGSSAAALDYSELTAATFSQACTAVSATNVYRANGGHSCSPSLNGVGMCFQGMESCNPATYNSADALKFEITIDPEFDGQLSGLTFNQKAPLVGIFTNGTTFSNNYPQKYLIRVYKNNALIYSQNDLNTSRDWASESFDFTGDTDFLINSVSTFRFELYPYCSVGNGYYSHVWDIDEIAISGCCVAPPEICGNGIDDDGDGLIDSADPDCFSYCPTGGIYFERWLGISGTAISNLTGNAAYPNNPTETGMFSSFAGPSGYADSYGVRARGYITPSETGNYTFNVTSDDASQLFLSTDGLPANMVQIAYVNSNTGIFQHDKFPSQTSGQISLVAGKTYYVEFLFKEGGGGDHFQVYWQTPSNSSWTIVPGANLRPFSCAENCSNGIDDDGDGDIDCADADCAPTILNVSSTSPNCPSGTNDGTITVTASAASGSVEYRLNSGFYQASNVFSGLSPGSYTVQVRKVGASCTDTWGASITLNAPSCSEICTDGIDNDGDGLIDCADPDCAPIVSAGNGISICSGSSITLTATANGGTAPYTFTWDNGLGAGESHLVSPAATTTYNVTVSSSTGCTSTAQVTVTITPCPEDCTDGIDNDGDGLIDCDDPDCQAVGMPSLVDDVFDSCPGVTYGNVVSMNDGNLKDPVFSIVTTTVNGNLSINNFGAFTYTPYNDNCGTDQFVYQVCNQQTGCCATANATINIGDDLPPVLTNIPADLTISCDDEIPSPPLIIAQDGCPGIFISLEETDNMGSAGSCGNYSITRTWTATDLCGNSSTGSQVISVADNVKPEIFRLYTLPNGKKMAAGLAQNTSHLWKYVKFPTHFSNLPLVFATTTSSNDGPAVSAQIRYVSTSGFEVRLMEEENADNLHGTERVSWMAIEQGDISGPRQLTANALPSVNHNEQIINYAQGFSSKPTFIAQSQTTNETDAFSIRVKNETASSIKVSLQEEQSADAETSHANEKVGYLAMTAGEDLLDMDGSFVGENGSVNAGQNWVTVNLANTFAKPVVLLSGLSSNDAQAATIRVRNVTQNSFEVRVQEWDYLDGIHPNEQLSYLVVEGGVPTTSSFFCGSNQGLQEGVNLFAIDNCDEQVAFGYTETINELPEGTQFIRSWIAIDDCGNVNLQSRYDTCKVAALKLKVLLLGPVDQISGNHMKDDLRKKQLLPLDEPYSAIANFEQVGRGGGEVVEPSILDISTGSTVVDWLFVECRSAIDDEVVLSTQSALLRSDGSVVSPTGGDVLYFWDLPEGDYFVSVRHRNHLGVMTEAPWVLSSTTPPVIDFSSPNVPLLNDAEAGKLINGHRALWAGDFNGDGNVTYQGPYNDVFFLFSKVMGDPGNSGYLANYISRGYNLEDFNLDGVTIYQGPDNDRSMLLYRTVLASPLNQSFLSNYIVISAIP